MHAVIAVALPVFAVIAAGLVAGRFSLASAADSAALNRFVYRFGFPAAHFALMSGARGLSADDARLAAAYGGAAILVIGGAYFIARRAFRFDAQDAGAHAFASTIGNAVFLGLPIALGIEGWARPFVTLMLVEGIVVISIGATLMAPRASSRGAGIGAKAFAFFKRPLTNPLVVAALAGFVFASLGFTLPAPVRTFFELLGRAAGPVALFSLGLFFTTRPTSKDAPPLARMIAEASAIALAKMAILPAMALFAAHELGVVDERAIGALALFTLTPTAVGAFVMASQYGRYVEETAAAIALTTALSVATIAGVLLFFT